MNRVVYGKFITAKCTSPVKSQLKWNERIDFCEGCTADWKSAYCLIHVLQDCEIVSPFWENMTEKLKKCNLISINYQKNISIYLGLRPDTSQFSLQLNFCFLLARHHMWSCRANNKTPLLTSFLVRLKSQFNIESNNPCLISKNWTLYSRSSISRNLHSNEEPLPHFYLLFATFPAPWHIWGGLTFGIVMLTQLCTIVMSLCVFPFF